MLVMVSSALEPKDWSNWEEVCNSSETEMLVSTEPGNVVLLRLGKGEMSTPCMVVTGGAEVDCIWRSTVGAEVDCIWRSTVGAEVDCIWRSTGVAVGAGR